MSTVLEFIGLSPAGLNGIPAEDPAKDEAARRTGELVMDLVRRDVRPVHLRHAQVASRTASPRSPRPAARPTASCTCWPSPTSSASRSTSTSSARSPTGRRSSPTCSRAAATGGRPVRRRRHRARHARAAQARRPAPRRRADGRRPDDRRDRGRREETPGQKVVLPIETPIKPTGGLAILRGTLAPDGCVVKLAGHERRQHRGPARVFDSETACFEAVKERRIVPGDVVVIR